MLVEVIPPGDAPDAQRPQSVDRAAFRSAARQFATGVTVATAADGEGRLHAITATAFCPLSLDPPLVLLALDGAGVLLKFVRASGHVGVSVLAADQQHVSEWASRHGREPGATLPDLDVETAATGAPLLRGAVAWFDCVVDAEHGHGDHVLIVGRVVEASVDDSRVPLLYLRGAYHDIGPARDRLTQPD